MFKASFILVLSESLVKQAAGQHFLVYGAEDCLVGFSCNAYHRPLCEECGDQHVKNPGIINLSFTDTANILSVEICKHHQIKSNDILM